MLWLRPILVHGFAVAILLGMTGCPRQEFILGDDWRDAGAKNPHPVVDAGISDAGISDGTSCGSRGQPACSSNEYCAHALSAACGATDAPGVCKPRPVVCTQEYAPVCGCDGKTYPNTCSAAGAGVSVARATACDVPNEPALDAGTPASSSCGGLRGAKCAAGQYCKFAIDAQCGAADQTGVCTDTPQACTLEYSPVCGCDGTTYGTACSAAAAGVSVASKGACAEADSGSPASICGGRSTATCPKGQFCNIPESGICGFADASGTCTPQPGACDAIYKPVCGCDGKTYGNACSAAVAGVSVKAQGECAGQVCGGLLGSKCAKGEYCDFPESAQCGSADQTGTCSAVPTACTKELNRVCGCDDKTYDNPCLAHAAGTSVQAAGACTSAPAGQTCGGLIGKTCDTKGQYCNFPTSTMCGSGDQSGTCTATPQACTQIYSPVCGCDGATYSNACMAATVGVSVKATGACP